MRREVQDKQIWRFFAKAVLLVLLVPADPAMAAEAHEQPLVHHDLQLTIDPAQQHLAAVDTITVPADWPPELHFAVNAGLVLEAVTPGLEVAVDPEPSAHPAFKSYTIKLPAGRRTFVLKYGGPIYEALEAVGKEQARGYMQTRGIISPEGVYLAGSSFWYPHFVAGAMLTFKMTASLPPAWDLVSQGRRCEHELTGTGTRVCWESPQPQEEIFAVAAKYSQYRRQAGRIEAMVFLRRPDAALAAEYLEATGRYLAMYEKLIGPYPYKKFAMVENFWETGFGMPSFTLLGPKVIRLPFILTSSYPHEILHNWWGNGVFAAAGQGNWTEGLTAYLADHLLKEQQGRAVEYRQATLQKYKDYVAGGQDFSLVEFVGRHSAATEAVGYGKALMFFHMLRLELGDAAFIKGLRDFYRRQAFRAATFDDLRQSFEEVSGRPLAIEFDQWVRRTGAPALRAGNLEAWPEKDGWDLAIRLEQVQAGPAYRLRVPLAITLAGRDQAWQTMAIMEDKKLELKLPVPGRPLRVDIDPEFDLFRELHRDEMPPALTRAFGARQVLVLLPAVAPEPLLRAYRQLADAWGRSGPEDIEVRLDSELESLPADRAVALFGWQNRFLDTMVEALAPYQAKIDPQSVHIGETAIPRQDHAVVLTVRHPRNAELALTWVAADSVAALPGLGRKLPHYHKYSYLGFAGPEPVNIVKGRWLVLNSPMTLLMPLPGGGAASGVEPGRLETRSALTPIP